MHKINKIISNKINLKKKNYSLIIGLTPSQGARSPKLWNKVYKNNKSQTKMYPADVEFKNLKKLVKFLKNDQFFIGGSVTVPYKSDIIKFIDGLDINAKKIGSVNTLVKKKKKIIGYNTDYFGALTTLKKIKKKNNILLFGAGGASRSVALALKTKFPDSNFNIYNRNKKRLSFLKKLFPNKKVKIFKKIKDISLVSNFDLIVNTTSIGFDAWIKKNNNKYLNLKYFSPITKIHKLNYTNKKNNNFFKLKNFNLISRDKNNLNLFFSRNKSLDVFDIIYNPNKSRLLRFAEKYNNKTYNGLEMNLMQAVKSFMLVNNIKNINKIKQVMQK